MSRLIGGSLKDTAPVESSIFRWRKISDLPVDITQYQKCFVVTRRGHFFFANHGSSSVYYSVDKGASWSTLSLAAGKTSSYLSVITNASSSIDYVIIGHNQTSYQYCALAVDGSGNITLSSSVSSPSGGDGSFNGAAYSPSANRYALSFNTSGGRLSVGYTSDLSVQGSGSGSSLSGFGLAIDYTVGTNKISAGGNDGHSVISSNGGLTWTADNFWAGPDGNYPVQFMSLGGITVGVGAGSTAGRARFRQPQDTTGASVHDTNHGPLARIDLNVQCGASDDLQHCLAVDSNRNVYYTRRGVQWTQLTPANFGFVNPGTGVPGIGYASDLDRFFLAIKDTLYISEPNMVAGIRKMTDAYLETSRFGSVY